MTVYLEVLAFMEPVCTGLRSICIGGRPCMVHNELEETMNDDGS